MSGSMDNTKGVVTLLSRQSRSVAARRGSTMTLQNLLMAVVRRRPSAVCWAYLPIALVSAFFALYGYGDGGFSAACPFLLLLLVCVLQSVYPTFLGWALLVGLSLVYTVAVAFSPENGTRGDYIFFLLCGAVPAIFLLLLRPTTRDNPSPNG